MILQWKEQKNSKDCHNIGIGNVQKKHVPEGSVQLKREELRVNAPQLEKKDIVAFSQYDQEEKVKFYI